LKEANVGSIGGGGHRDSKVVDVGDDKCPGNSQVEGGDVYDEQKGGDGGSLGDPNRDRREEARGPLKRQAAGAIPEERADPLDQVWAYPLSAEESEERGRFHVIKASLHIEEESGHFVAEAVEGFNVVL